MLHGGERDPALWFKAFVAEHQSRFPRSDWPAEKEERLAFFRPWKNALAKSRATGDMAEQASLRLAENPPRFLSDHLPALLKHIGDIRRERSGESGEYEDRAAAEAASANCMCGGGGLVSRQIRHGEGWMSVACYCPECAAGRWMKRAHDRSKDLRGRFVDPRERPELLEQDVPVGAF